MTLSLAADWWQGSDVAVVVAAELDAKGAPDESSVVRFKLHSGTEVRVLEERPGWLMIALPDGERGWVDRSLVELTV